MLDVQLKTEHLSEVTRALVELPGIFQRARGSALKSIAYQVKEELQQQARRGDKGNYLAWQALNPHTPVIGRAKRRAGGLQYRRRRWKRGEAKGQVIQRTRPGITPFLRLIAGIRYKVDVEDNFAEIGFINPKTRLAAWLRKHETGETTAVTPRKRRFLFAIGFPLAKGTTTLKTPARPWVSKVYEHMRGKIPSMFEEKFLAAMARYGMKVS